MMNELGMGVVVSMKDMFTRNAQRIQASMMSLDATVAAPIDRLGGFPPGGPCLYRRVLVLASTQGLRVVV